MPIFLMQLGDQALVAGQQGVEQVLLLDLHVVVGERQVVVRSWIASSDFWVNFLCVHTINFSPFAECVLCFYSIDFNK